jgi:hypothetical protein
MSFGFAVLCLLAGGIPLGILYFLHGPTRGRPLVAVPRASLVAMPQVARVTGHYDPERVFASEQQLMIAKASAVARVAPRGPTPPPIPRSRAARGSDAPPVHRDTMQDAPNPFLDEGPTMHGVSH